MQAISVLHRVVKVTCDTGSILSDPKSISSVCCSGLAQRSQGCGSLATSMVRINTSAYTHVLTCKGQAELGNERYVGYHRCLVDTYMLYKRLLRASESTMTDAATANYLQVQETLPDVVLEKMHAPPKPDVPFIEVADLVNADGFVFGFPTRCTSTYCNTRAHFHSHSHSRVCVRAISLPPLSPPPSSLPPHP